MRRSSPVPRAWCLAAVAGLIACTLAGCSDPPPAPTPETPEAGQQPPAAPPAANVLPPATPPQRQPQQRPIPPPGSPNLLLISIDTLRADHLGCYGHPAQATPNLDALAEAGTIAANDLDLFRFVETAQEAIDIINNWQPEPARQEIPGR